MMTPQVAVLNSNAAQGKRNGSDREAEAQPVLLRLDGVRGTAANRQKIGEQVRELNRELEESDVPFRVRIVR